LQDVEDPRTESLREYCYGLVLPIICAMGIIGNVLNLIVLTRRNMRGTAYIYMRGKHTYVPHGTSSEESLTTHTFPKPNQQASSQGQKTELTAISISAGGIPINRQPHASQYSTI